MIFQTRGSGNHKSRFQSQIQIRWKIQIPTHTYFAGDDEASLLAARRLCGQHALPHRPPDPRHEYHPALHEGECLWEDEEGVVLGKMIIGLDNTYKNVIIDMLNVPRR